MPWLVSFGDHIFQAFCLDNLGLLLFELNQNNYGFKRVILKKFERKIACYAV